MANDFVVTFDLDTTSKDPDYAKAWEILEKMGLKKSLVGNSGKPSNLPKNTAGGEKKDGQTVITVADDISARFAKEKLRLTRLFVGEAGTWIIR